jgi:hypothetical protein
MIEANAKRLGRGGERERKKSLSESRAPLIITAESFKVASVKLNLKLQLKLHDGGET